MKIVLPAALAVALGLAAYAAVGGPNSPAPPATPKPWHNTAKADPQAMGRGIQPRQLGVSVSAPFQVQPGWTTNPLYVEWYHYRGTQLHKVSDPY